MDNTVVKWHVTSWVPSDMSFFGALRELSSWCGLPLLARLYLQNECIFIFSSCCMIWSCCMCIITLKKNYTYVTHLLPFAWLSPTVLSPGSQLSASELNPRPLVSCSTGSSWACECAREADSPELLQMQRWMRGKGFQPMKLVRKICYINWFTNTRLTVNNRLRSHVEFLR